jgi:hypothetical protein
MKRKRRVQINNFKTAIFSNFTIYFLSKFVSLTFYMTSQQQQKIKELVSKYNDILLNSMRLAVAEDFINLMLLNRDDKEFELKNLMEDKNDFYNSILKEFMKQNSSSVLDDLKKMEDPTIGIKTLQKKINKTDRTENLSK